MKFAIGADHGAVDLKEEVKLVLKEFPNINVVDIGTFSHDPVDYPDIAEKVAEKITSGECERGIVLCGTGIGISIAANKINGIRCALCSDVFSAKMARRHNDANMLAMGAGVIGENVALDIVETFLDTPFSFEEKHVRRVGKIAKVDGM